MSKWCDTCYITGKYKPCGENCPVFRRHFGELAHHVISHELGEIKPAEREINAFNEAKKMVETMKLLLFSDHTWFYCYEHQVDEFIRNHRWKLPDNALKYVMVYDGDMDYTLIKIDDDFRRYE